MATQIGLLDKSSVERAARTLGRLRLGVLDHRMRDSLNAQAFSGRKAERTNAARVLDRPRRFTIDSLRAQKARTSGPLESSVYVAPAMRKILSRLEEGGTEKSGLHIVDKAFENEYGDLGPRGVKRILNRDRKSKRRRSAKRDRRARDAAGKLFKGRGMGKIARGTVFRSAAGGKVANPHDRFFLAEFKGTRGLWRRRAGKRRGAGGSKGGQRLELVVAFERDPIYKPLLGFIDAAREAGGRYPDKAREAFERAMREAKV